MERENYERTAHLRRQLFGKLTDIIISSRQLPERIAKFDTSLNLVTERRGIMEGNDFWKELSFDLTVTLHIRDLEASSWKLMMKGGDGVMREIDKEMAWNGIVLEQWSLNFEPDILSIKMEEFVKDTSILVRSLFTLTRLLPAHKLKSLLKQRDEYIYITVTRQVKGGSLSLDESIMGVGAYEPSSQLKLANLQTPHGSIILQVRYRRQCNFDLIYNQDQQMSVTSLRPSSFENVELEAAAASSSPLGKSPLAAASPIAMSMRTRSIQTIQSPLNTTGSFGRRTTSPSLASLQSTSLRRGESSSLHDDSILANFIRRCEHRPTLPPVTMELPSLQEVKDRLEKVRLKMGKASIVDPSSRSSLLYDSRLKLTISPVIEEDHQVMEDKNSPSPSVHKNCNSNDEPIIFNLNQLD